MNTCRSAAGLLLGRAACRTFTAALVAFGSKIVIAVAG